MRLALYLVSTYLIAVLCMAYGSRGPDEMIVNAFIVWAPPAILALATRNKPTAVARYLPPAVALALMIYLMLLGTGAITI